MRRVAAYRWHGADAARRVASLIWQGVADGQFRGLCPDDLAQRALDVLRGYVRRGLDAGEIRQAWARSDVAAEVREAAEHAWWQRKIRRGA